MRKLLVLLSISAFFLACDEKGSSSSTDTASSDTAVAADTNEADSTATDTGIGSDTSTQDTFVPPPPQVQVDDGLIEGLRQDGLQVFWGIPFAKPPVGDLRWALPELPEPWTDTLQATERPPQCPQPAQIGPTGLADNEDCLFLNVWAPDPLPSGAPVMVWIHGGGYLTGSGAQALWDGTHIVPEGVILVSINYRLGPLGFLAHKDLPDGNGNFGFIDQQLALAWVQANIDAFGGDPSNVTIFGESAGAFSVCTHIAAPSSNGLFQKAILESGTCSALPMADAQLVGDDVAAALACDTENDIVACMRSKAAMDVVGATPNAEGFFFGGGASWSPVIDGVRIPSEPGALIAEGKGASVPVLMGTNSDEGTIFLALGQITFDETTYETALTDTFGSDAPAVLARYPVANYADPNAAMAALLGDGVFVCPARRLARGMDAQSQAVWMYHFTRVVDWLFFPDLGAFHASELAFIFQIPFPGVTLTADDRLLGTEMLGYWTRFAKTGDPNDGTAATWDAFDATADNHIEFNWPISAGSGLKSDTCDFWDSIAP